MGAVLYTGLNDSKTLEPYSSKPEKRLSNETPPSFLVMGLERPQPATACKWGISPGERKWLVEGMSYLERQRGHGVFISLEPSSKLITREVHELSRDIKRRLNVYRVRADMKRLLWLEVFETKPGLHFHIVAIFSTAAVAEKAVTALNASPKYLALGPKMIFAEPVTNWADLPKYLLGEATSQTWRGAGMSFPRVKGSHAIEGESDRVLVSRHDGSAIDRAESRVEAYRLAVSALRPYRESLFENLSGRGF
jgi:hypothetical protein